MSSPATTETAPAPAFAPLPPTTVKHWVYWAISLVLPVALYLGLPTGGGLTEEARKFLALTLWALLAWAFDIMPVYISGVALTLAYILTGTATPAVVFEPWTGMVVWLTLGGLTLSVIFERTGLLLRIAYWFIAASGGSYRGVVIGLSLSGIVVGLLVPNMTGRVALYAALTYGIIRALDIKPNTKEAAGIMFGGFIAATASAWFYLSASENLQLINSYLINAGGGVTWLEFFLATFVPALIFMALLTLATVFMFKGDLAIENGREYFRGKYQAMGKLGSREIKFLVILTALVLAMIFTKIAPGWLFMTAVVLCFLPGVNVASGADLKGVNYMMVFFVAATMSIGSVAAAVGLPKLVTGAMLPMLTGADTYSFTLLIFGFGVVVNFLMTPLAGMTAFVPTLIELAQSLGLSPNAAAFGFVWGVEQIVLPYEWALFLILFSYDQFDIKKAALWSTARMILAFAVLAVAILPFWMLTGFVG